MLSTMTFEVTSPFKNGGAVTPFLVAGSEITHFMEAPCIRFLKTSRSPQHIDPFYQQIIKLVSP